MRATRRLIKIIKIDINKLVSGDPAALGKAVVFGPNMQNFPQVVPQFLERGGACQVRDAAELESVLGELLADPARRTELGRRALEVVRDNQGGIEKTVEMIVASVHEVAV